MIRSSLIDPFHFDGRQVGAQFIAPTYYVTLEPTGAINFAP